MSNLHIVAADGITGSGLDLLRDAFGADAIEVRGKFTEDELCEKIGNMDALLIRSGTTVTPKALAATSGRLKIIGRAGVGTDNIDKPAATEQGIIVMNTPLGNIISAAEQAIALIFASARNISRADRLMQAGEWAKKALTGVEVQGKILGLIGLGKVGSHVAKVMKAAGMEVVAFDPFLSPDRAKQLGVTLADFDTVLCRSDFISLHTPLTDQTRGLLGRENLARMKPGVRLVNCARGGIVDETALAELVKSGHIAAAGMDVFAAEPTTSGPLFGVDDLTLAPHLGAATEEAGERVGVQIAEQVIAYFKDGAIINAVNISINSDKTLKPYVDVARSMGRAAAILLDAAPESIEVASLGQLEDKDTGEITAAAVQGVLQACGVESANVVNVDGLAKARGIRVSEGGGGAAGTYLSRVDLTVCGGERTLRLSGTAYDGTNPRIVRIDDYEVDLKLNPYTLIMRYPDRPGYVGKFGTLMAENNINIADMEVGRMKKAGTALTAFGLDEAPMESVMEAVRAIDGVESAHLVAL